MDRHPGAGEESTEQTLRALGAELLRLTRRGATAPPGTRLDASVFRLLWLLDEGPARTQRDLAHELQLDPSTITRQVRAAIEQHLLERYDEDGVRVLRTTAAGRAAYEHDGGLRGALYTSALEELGAERAGRLIADLRDLNDALDRQRPR